MKYKIVDATKGKKTISFLLIAPIKPRIRWRRSYEIFSNHGMALALMDRGFKAALAVKGTDWVSA
jgi:hypothetical protein